MRLFFREEHKAYGAYYVRRKYNSSLLFSLLSSVSLVALLFSTPALIRLIGGKMNSLLPSDKTLPVIEWIQSIPVSPPAHQAEGVKSKPAELKQSQNQHSQPVVTTNEPDISATLNSHESEVKPGVSAPDNPITQALPPNLPEGNGNKSNLPLAPEPKKEEAVRWAPVMPVFSKGDLQKWLRDNMGYPVEAINRKIEGTVYASFIIEGDGMVSSVHLVHGVENGSMLDSEAVRVLRSMPNWSPGLQNGHPVRVQFTIPIDFRVQ